MTHCFTRRLAFLLTWLLVIGTVSSGWSDSEEKSKQARDADEYYELFEVFADSLDQIERNYVKQLSRRELVEAAIQGMVEKLDQHSSFIGPKEVDNFRVSVENKFGGIGISVAIEDGWLTVISPLIGSPAYKAGLVPGDQIIEIEGKSCKGISLSDAVRTLKGKVGTKVTITVRHGTDGKPRKVTLKRDTVSVETVLGFSRNQDDSWDFMYDDDRHIGYVRLSSFSRDTAHELKKALEQLTKEHLKGLILDLRFNPGGLLTSAIEISDMFVDEGLIVSTKGRNIPERKWNAKKAGTFRGFPMVVMVNRYSASASEILSACLKDHDRAVVIGERTFGKGSVQNVIPLEDGESVLKLTTASYWRPNGKNIHRFEDAKDTDDWGVIPSDGYDMKMSDEELRKLHNLQRDHLVAHGKPPQGAGDSSAEQQPDDEAEELKDRHLEKALEYLSGEIARAG